MGGEGEPALKAFLDDPGATGPAQAMGQRLLRERLAEVLRPWPPRGREVIAPRFGLRDGHPKVLKEVVRSTASPGSASPRALFRMV